MEQTSFYVGRHIGNYRIEQRLASGGSGTVYLARHIHLDQRRAVIKLLHTLPLDSEDQREQFIQEARILESLRGLPHILPILDFGIEPDGYFPYLIAEYAELGSLRALIKQEQEPFSFAVALDILEQIGKGLQTAHDRQIVHRDIKPENILFNARGEALVADFGLSMELTTTSIKQTDVVGSPAYMAPEQFRGHFSKESDQYALACVAYELLAGQRPFIAKDVVALGFLHVSEPPQPLNMHNVQVPAYAEQAILKAMAKERAERFSSIQEFINALRSATNRRQTQELSETALYRSSETAHSEEADQQTVDIESAPQEQFLTPLPYQSTPQPWSDQDFFSITNRLRVLTALTYLFSPFFFLFSILLYAYGNRNYFARFHLMQSLLFWMVNVVIIALLYLLSGGSTPVEQLNFNEQVWMCILVFWVIAEILLLFTLSLFPLQGRYFKLPLFGNIAEKYARRGHV